MKFYKSAVVFLLVGIVMLFCVKIPLYASAQTINQSIGYLDRPVSNNTLNGTQNVYGWFLDDSGVASIEVLVDGAVVGQAVYGDERPDVHKVFPQYNNEKSGFHYALDTTQFTDGRHAVTVRARGNNGQVTALPSRMITVENAMGYMDKPFSGSTLNGTQNVYGWFLDDSGVDSIEVLVDGAVVGQATYGDARPDVQKVYPQYNNGNSGYHYALDTTQFTDGRHTVSVRETGKNGQVTTLPSSTITIENAMGYMDKPVTGTTHNGIQNVYGWFLDDSGVESIEVLVDGAVVGQATYGDARPDVQKVYPQYNNGNSGYHYALDTTQFTDGRHTVTVRETGKNGQVTTLSSSIITIENAMGYIDNPTSGKMLNGVQNVYGWFLDDSGVANIEVLVDGTVVGQAIYGDTRLDVQKVYPQYNNGNAGFHYALDTTQFNDGQHTVSIRETGKNGQVTTLSSIITIENAMGFIDKPVTGTTLKGIQNVNGWFLDDSGVAKIEVLVDGTVVGQAIYGDARPDVQKAYPQYNNGSAGFHYALDTTKFPSGQHVITIRETGKNGRVTTLPNRIVTFKQSTTVFLDPGHGGSDPGATAGMYHEADLNLAVAKKVQSLLLNRGYQVYMSRTNDTYLGLLDRPQMANDLAADIFVSIHTNSTAAGETSATGIESYYYEYDPNYPSKINGNMHNDSDRILKSMNLTNLIQENMINYTGAYNRGTDGETFAVIREAAMPATLLEMGFINNSSDRQKLFTDSYQNQLAKAIADGIDEYFRIY